MNFSDLETSLNAYAPNLEEAPYKPRFLELLTKGDACLYRNYFEPGHITGSALLISRDRKKILLNHHRFLNKWLCFGGHADGNPDMLDVARRELMEESGIRQVWPLTTSICDIDIHPIPVNPQKNEPAHEHFDIRFIFWTDEMHFEISAESTTLRWCTFNEGLALAGSPEMRRLLGKAGAQAAKASS